MYSPPTLRAWFSLRRQATFHWTAQDYYFACHRHVWSECTTQQDFQYGRCLCVGTALRAVLFDANHNRISGMVGVLLSNLLSLPSGLVLFIFTLPSRRLRTLEIVIHQYTNSTGYLVWLVSFCMSIWMCNAHANMSLESVFVLYGHYILFFACSITHAMYV